MRIIEAFRTMPVLILSALVLAALPAGTLQAAAAQPTVLTVIGAVGESNRPPFDPFADSLFAFNDLTFDEAYAFDRTALLALPQQSLVANATNWERAVSASGPSLSDVLKEAGVSPDAALTLIALDGYAVELDAAARKAKDWVLALSADGTALSIGGRGPLWLLYDTGGEAISDDGEAKWVYSVFTIMVK